ncbi:hypothetical protein RKD56_000977 [Priestia megaterium]
MKDIIEAFKRGKEVRAKQDNVIALLNKNIRNIEDISVLDTIEKTLKGVD